jgi:hypothetical protein
MPPPHQGPITNGNYVNRNPLECHNCHSHPAYPSHVTSFGAKGKEDYPLVGNSYLLSD